MSRVVKTALVCGVALSLGACSTVQNLWPWGKDEPQAVATDGERVSIIEFEQALAPALPALRRALGEAGASTRLEWLKREEA